MAFLTQQMNVLLQSPILGQLDLIPAPNVVSAQIYVSSVAYIQVGQTVKLVAGTSGAIVVDAHTGPTDASLVFGVVIYNERQNIYAAGSYCEVATAESYVYLLSSAAIARGAIVATTAGVSGTSDPTVATDATSTHNETGYAVDAASAANQLIRVRIFPFTHV